MQRLQCRTPRWEHWVESSELQDWLQGGNCRRGREVSAGQQHHLLHTQCSAAAPHHTSDLLWRPTSQVSTGAWSLASLLSLQWSEEVLGKSNEKQRTGSCWRPAEQSSWLGFSP